MICRPYSIYKYEVYVGGEGRGEKERGGNQTSRRMEKGSFIIHPGALHTAAVANL